MKEKIKHFVDSRYFEYFLYSLVFILGFLVRLYKIDSPIADWHSWRQADTASVSRIYMERGIDLLHPRYQDISSIQSGIFNPEGYRMVEFPFYNAINALLAANFPFLSLEIWARVITITSALCTSFFLFLIGRRVLGRWGGVLTALFYLFIPFNIYFTRVILPDPLGVMFAIVSVWAFIEFVDKGKKRMFLVSAVFLALAFLIKPYLGFYIFPSIYLAWKKFGIKNFFRDRKVIFGLFLYMAIVFIPFLLWRMHEGNFPEGIPFYKWAFNGNLIRFKPSWWYWIFGERLGHLILGSLGVIPFVFGILNTRTKDLIIQMFLMGALFYVAVVASANVMHDYYQILIIPAVALALGSGSVYLWNTTSFNKYLTRSVLVISVGVMFIVGWNQVKGKYLINHPEIIEAGAAIDVIAPKNALVVAPYNGDTAFLYQTKRSGWPAVDDSIDNIIEKGADYYVSVDLNSPDTRMIEERFEIVKRTDKYVIIKLNSGLSE